MLTLRLQNIIIVCTTVSDGDMYLFNDTGICLENRMRLQKIISHDHVQINNIITVKQVHGESVLTYPDCSLNDNAFLHSEADGIITKENNTLIGVTTADCIPVALWQKEGNIISIFHAGWRGIQKRIYCKGIDKLNDSADTDDIYAFIGCGISEEYYKVGKEFCEIFPKYIREKNGTYFLSLRDVIYDDLTNCGIFPENIITSPYCTYAMKEYFFSYRRDGEKTGRFLTGIARVS
ncbi:polyphenol oxidase family protein [Spirochaetota bacterium]